jgi:hypothetical protein
MFVTKIWLASAYFLFIQVLMLIKFPLKIDVNILKSRLAGFLT